MEVLDLRNRDDLASASATSPISQTGSRGMHAPPVHCDCPLYAVGKWAVRKWKKTRAEPLPPKPSAPMGSICNLSVFWPDADRPPVSRHGPIVARPAPSSHPLAANNRKWPSHVPVDYSPNTPAVAPTGRVVSYPDHFFPRAFRPRRLGKPAQLNPFAIPANENKYIIEDLALAPQLPEGYRGTSEERLAV